MSEIYADTTLSASTESVPIYATFEVPGAAASLTGAAVSRSQVSGGITLAYNGQGATSKTLVDNDPATGTPGTFAGRIVLATTIPSTPGGSLSITAGTSGSATVAEGDVANARVDVTATLESIQIGGTAPSLDPTTPSASSATYTAPFGGTAEAWSQRNDVRTNWNWEDASGATFDAQSGDVGFQFDAVGLSRAGHGWYEGEARFTLEHGGIARGSTVTVKVVWEMTTATSFHTPCVVFDDCNFAGTGAYMCLERPDGEPLSSWDESCAEGGLFFDDGESGTQTDGRLELVVTVPDVTSDSIVIETVAESILSTLGGYGEFEFDGRLKSVTVEQS